MNNDDASLHEYPTFNGMGHSAMMLVIPIMALVLASVGSAILALIAGGNKGFLDFLVAIVALPVFGVFAFLCLTLAKDFMSDQTMSDQTSWSDVFIKCLWIVCTGAAPALARWIFAIGQKMTF